MPSPTRSARWLAICAGLAATLSSPFAVVGAQGDTTRRVGVPAASPNPFFAPSPLFDQAPPFDKIHDADYQPALDSGMAAHLAEANAIADQSDPPTFDNTIVALERSGRLLTRVQNVFSSVTEANTDDTLDAVQRVEAPKMAAHTDAIRLNPKLFARIDQLYQQRTQLGLNPVQQFLVERYYRDFTRAGARLGETDKARLRAMNQEEASLSTAFRQKLLAATKAGALTVTDRSALAGLSDAELAAAASAATSRGREGQWVIPLQNTTQQPAQASLTNRDTRQQLFVASTQRAEHGDSNDTRAIVLRLAQLRAARAQLLGYPTHAAYILDNNMAKTPEAALKLMSDLAPAAAAKARAEDAKIQALIDRQHGGFTLAAWDRQYYAEQVRKAEYALDESQIKPYFELDRVLRDGVFFAANKLYGLTFKERHDIPVYQPDVRVFEVFDADGSSLALWYCDYFKRDNKGGGAWESALVGQSGLLGTKPVIYNVANFAKPAPGAPALLSFSDVTTMFHEFGHALHAMMSHVEYPRLAGTSVPRDVVEFPSQFNEHWALDPTVLAHYAHHYKTGAPMPRALVAKIKKARTFDQGFALTEYLAAALLDMAWHTQPADAPQPDVDAFEAAALARYHVDLPTVPPRYRTTYFSHIWDAAYSAGYYAYLWSEVLDDDAFAWFTEHGGLTRANGQRFRDLILSRGGTEDAGEMYRSFRGRDARIEPLLKQRGLTN